MLVAPIVVLWAVTVGGELAALRRITNAVISGAFVAVGFLAALGVGWLQTGTWTAYFKTQSKYTTDCMSHSLCSGPTFTTCSLGHTGRPALPAIEATVVSGMMLVLLAGIIFLRVKGRASNFELLIALYLLAFWLVPYTQADVSYYRATRCCCRRRC